MTLARHTPSTRLGEIVRYTETNRDVAQCFTASTNTCPIIGVCQLKPVLYRARKAFFKVLDSVTVQEIARDPGADNQFAGPPVSSRLVAPVGSKTLVR